MVFQPHRYTRTKDLFTEFAEVLSEVDSLILLNVYSAGEEVIEGINSDELMKKIIDLNFNKVEILNDVSEIIKSLESKIDKDSVLIMQGAGDISDISTEIRKKYLDL